MKRFLLAVMAIGVLAAAGLTWQLVASRSGAPELASPAAKSGAPAATPVKVDQVRSGTVTEEVTAVGTLLAHESVMIRPEIDGRIAKIHFVEGQLVRKGEDLLALDAAEAEAQLAAVSAEVNLNRSRAKRAEELHAKKFISGEALDEARENLNQSLARQAEIAARLAKAVVKAPFEGVVGLRQVSPGAYVKAGQDIARLEGIGTLKLDFRAPEMQIGRIRPKQDVLVRVDAYPGETFRGRIYAIEPAIDEATRSVLLRAHVPNPGGQLKPGMFVRVNLVIETRENALLVPEQALVPAGAARYVYRVVDGRVERTKVELGQRRTGEVEILEGVAPGDTVVVDGQLRLKDGAAVAPQ
jgi:membrane fusion protein, multidrug efflux system